MVTSGSPFRIGIDLMGSERAPEALFESIPAVVQHLPKHIQLVVFATSDVVAALSPSSPSIEFVTVSDVIAMEDEPLSAIRLRKDSSLVVGIKQTAQQQIHAFISAGNTGALIASASIFLPQMVQMERPALLATMPTKHGPMAVLDVGGNVSMKPEHLVQFALMGAAYQRSRHDRRTPKVGLLNIGAESKKGTPEHREAFQLLTERSGKAFEFVGNVEGRDVFDGIVDVLVTDGFTGNVFLKTSEGVSAFLLGYLRDALGNSQELHALSAAVNHDNASGAIVCGVEGIVIKCHGASSSRAFQNAILEASHLLQASWLQQMKSLLH